LDMKGKVPFLYILCVVLLFVAIAYNPSVVLFVGFLAYMISGLITLFIRVRAVSEDAIEPWLTSSRLGDSQDRGGKGCFHLWTVWFLKSMVVELDSKRIKAPEWRPHNDGVEDVQ